MERKSVLLVDDIGFILEFETKVIESLEKDLGVKIDIDTAGSVEAAKDLIAGREYDVAIVDMNLPDGTGSDVVSIIRAKGGRTRVAALTIYPERYEEDQGNFDAYFKKPILPTIYKENLRALLQV